MFSAKMITMVSVPVATTLGQAPVPAKVGEMTYYDPNTGSQVACGGFFGPNDRIAGLGAGSFDGKNVCRKVASVTLNGKTAKTVIHRDLHTTEIRGCR